MAFVSSTIIPIHCERCADNAIPIFFLAICRVYLPTRVFSSLVPRPRSNPNEAPCSFVKAFSVFAKSLCVERYSYNGSITNMQRPCQISPKQKNPPRWTSGRTGYGFYVSCYVWDDGINSVDG